MCPGCGRSGVRGGVRCNDGGEQQVEQHDATQAAVPTNHIYQAALRTEENENFVDVSTVGWARRSREYSASRSSPTDVSSSTDCVAAGGTFCTSLGVVVDICTWQQQGGANVGEAARGDRDGERNECSRKRANGEHGVYRTPCLHNYSDFMNKTLWLELTMMKAVENMKKFSKIIASHAFLTFPCHHDKAPCWRR